jgi:hypothetical protein
MARGLHTSRVYAFGAFCIAAEDLWRVSDLAEVTLSSAATRAAITPPANAVEDVSVVGGQVELLCSGIRSISNTRVIRPGSALPLFVILLSRIQRASCPSAKKLIGQVITGRRS